MKNNNTKETQYVDMKELGYALSTIKQDIIKTRNKILYESNKELIYLYFRIGKTISENQKYGSRFIKTLSTSLRIDFPNSTGFSTRNLARMKKFYEEYLDISNLPTPLAKLPWSFNCLLIDKISNINIRVWYAEKTLSEGWSYNILENQINLSLYDRQSHNENKLENFHSILKEEQSKIAIDMMKEPYIFEIVGITENMNELNIERTLVEKIKNVILELGKGFSFVGNQYRISTQSKDFYIDLLFYHLNLRCFVVLELKNSDFDPSYIGQLQFYITAVDETLKKEDDNQTIGLLLCKRKDKKSVEWSLKSTNAPIGVASYLIYEYLPTEEEMNCYLSDSQLIK